jgi:GAF domain-containing protein
MKYPQRLLRSFQELSGLVLSQESVGSTLDVVSNLAVQTIPTCDVASVSLVRPDGISTVGSSHEVAQKIDAIQYATGEGPCLDAIGKSAMWFQIDDMTNDSTWPTFSSRAAQEGFKTLLAFTLRVDDDTLGALNLYAHDAHAFSEEDRDFGAIYAAHAAVALANAQASADLARSVDGPAQVDVSQEIVARAVGILMEREVRSGDEALKVLEERAQELKVRLRTAAQEVISTSDRERADLELPEGFAERMMGRARDKKLTSPLRIPLALLWIGMFLLGALLTGLVMGPKLDDATATAQARGEALHASLANGDGLLLQGAGGAVGRMTPGQEGSVFVSDSLTEPPSGHTYQLWLMRDGEVVADRVFRIDQGIALVQMAEPLSAFDQVAVTLEPGAGSEAPTTDPVLASS